MDRRIIAALSLLLLASLACQAGATPEPTATPSPSPLPTETATTVPTDTATPSPTPDLTETAVARATSDAAQILPLVRPAFEALGLSTDQGQLAWYDLDSVEIVDTNPNSIVYDYLAPGEMYSDFVLGVDVAWESETGVAGCGLVLRSEEDIQRGRQLQFVTLRLSGLPAWDIELHEFGQYQAELTGGPHTNAAIRQSQGSSNRYLVVAQGSSLTVYVNDERLGAATFPADLTDGILGIFTWQESGRTTCTFGNAWIWELPSE